MKRWVRFVPSLNCWMDTDRTAVLEHVKNYIKNEELLKELFMLKNDLVLMADDEWMQEAFSQYHKAQHALTTVTWATSAVKQLEGETLLRVENAQFDADPELLNFTNGYLDLRTLVFTSHNSGHVELFRHCVGYAYDPDAQCPRWDAFLAETFPGDELLPTHDQVIRYFQQAGGTALIGRMSPNRDVYWVKGVSSTGKSVAVNMLAYTLGMREARGTGYARALDNSLLMRGAQNSRMGCTLDGLDKIRLVTFNELPGGRVDVTQFRTLSSMDAVQVRGNYKDGRDAYWTHTLFTTTNFDPLIDNDDGAVWERIRVLEFAHRVPDAKRDLRLEAKLKREIQGICNFFVQGAQRVLLNPQEYVGKLPKAIAESGRKYQDSMDLLRHFFDDALLPADDDEGGTPLISTDTLFELYQLWTRRQGMQWKPSKARFKTMLHNKGFDPEHRHMTTTGKRIRGLPGYRLQEEYELELRKELQHKGRSLEVFRLAPRTGNGASE